MHFEHNIDTDMDTDIDADMDTDIDTDMDTDMDTDKEGLHWHSPQTIVCHQMLLTEEPTQESSSASGNLTRNSRPPSDNRASRTATGSTSSYRFSAFTQTLSFLCHRLS